MSEDYLQLPVSKLLNIQLLIDYLDKFVDKLFFSSDNVDPDNTISYKIFPNKTLQIKKIETELLSNILLNLKVSCDIIDIAKSILSVVRANKDLFILSEILSHGIAYFDAVEKINLIFEHVEEFLLTRSKTNESNTFLIPLENFKLEILISFILQNGNQVLIFIPTIEDRSLLSCFILLTLLHDEKPQLINQLIFLLPANTDMLTNSIVSTKTWFIENQMNFTIPQNIFIKFPEQNSSFLVLDDCDLFSAAVNYLNAFGSWSSRSDKPKLCLVQENVYEKFVSILKSRLTKSNLENLFDCNRQISLNYVNDVDRVLQSLSSDTNVEILTEINRSGDVDSHWFAPFIVTGVQPQHKILYDKSVNELSSFLLTFRTIEEGITLANKIYRHRSRLYLWAENVSQCLALKSRLDYNEIFVNTIDKVLFQPYSQLQIAKLFNDKSSSSPLNDAPPNLSPNQIGTAIQSLKSSGDNRAFRHRYAKVVDIIASSESTILRGNISSFDKLKEFFDNLNWKNSLTLSTYATSSGGGSDCHILEERLPIGCVLIYVGGADVDGDVLRLLLLAWMFGNDVVFISHSYSVDELRQLLQCHRICSVRVLRGAIAKSDLVEWVGIDSVIWLGDCDSDHCPMDKWNCRFVQVSPDATADGEFMESFCDETPFFMRRKVTVIQSGGLNTK